MALMMPILRAALAVGFAYASNELSTGESSGMVAEKAMEQVFFRSDAAHSSSMASIMSGMTIKAAWQVLQKGDLIVFHATSFCHPAAFFSYILALH